MKYAIFIEDMEIHVDLILGDRESMDTIRETIRYQIADNPNQEKGYCESYPFWQCNWEVIGYGLQSPDDFNSNEVMEITDKKRFLCTWGEGYVLQKSQIVPMDQITEENGWFDEYIHMIDMARIGDVVDCSDPSGVLHVKRIA